MRERTCSWSVLTCHIKSGTGDSESNKEEQAKEMTALFAALYALSKDNVYCNQKTIHLTNDQFVSSIKNMLYLIQLTLFLAGVSNIL